MNRPMSEQAKTRASRIALTYYARKDRFSRMRPIASFAACAAVVIFIFVSKWAGSDGNGAIRKMKLVEIASPGALAQPHALWERQCDVCHRPGQAINPDRALSWFAGEVANEPKCLHCHSQRPHHANMAENFGGNCAQCHPDHRGRTAGLTAVNDTACISCHRDTALFALTKSGDSTRPVIGFDENEHPEFAVLRNAAGDSSSIRFDHALHLAPGQNPNGLPLIRFADLPEADRTKYGMKDLSQLGEAITLNCISCHRHQGSGMGLSENESPESVGFAVNYERDCKACHSLAYRESGEKSLVAPHGLSVEATLENIRLAILEESLLKNPSVLQRRIPGIEIPGKPIGPIDAEVQERVEAEVGLAAEMLFGRDWESQGPNGMRGCAECHSFEKSGTASKWAVRPVRSMSARFESATFDHSKHRLVDCGSCHSASESRKASDVLLPGVRTCFACHGEKSLSERASASSGNSCVTCHKYHGANRSIPDVGTDREFSKPHPELSEILDAVRSHAK